MHALVDGSTVVQFPYTLWDLRRDHPNTGFPDAVSDETLADYGMVPVVPTEPTLVNYTANVTQGEPVLVGNVWQQTWLVSDASEAEIEQRVYDQWTALRAERNAKLAASDWTQVLDAPVDQDAWADYRQALRDLPDNTTDPFAPAWPVEPGA